jgi:hypothetical protein
MAQDCSREDLLQFLDYLGSKGLVAPATAAARRSASARVLSVLSNDEASNVLTADLDHVMSQFENLNRGEFTPDSLRTYKSRLKTALGDFRGYIENPVTFRPSGRSISKKGASDGGKVKRKATSNSAAAAVHIQSTSAPAVDMPNSNQLPIALRQNVVIRIFGLPFDLTKPEAQKIANIILAHAQDQ